MVKASRVALLLCTFAASLVSAQLGFSAPDGKKGDLTSDLDEYQGSEYEIKWLLTAENQKNRTLNGKNILDSNGNVSLWITSWTDNGSKWNKCLLPSVNSENGGSYKWTVDLTNDDIDAQGGKFVYRLKPAVASVDSTFSTTSTEIPSRGFRIVKAQVVSSSSASSSTTSTATSTESTTATSSTASTSATTSPVTDTPNNNDGGLSTGAKAGIAVGVVVVALAVIGFAGFIFWRRRRQNAGHDAGVPPSYQPPLDQQQQPQMHQQQQYAYYNDSMQKASYPSEVAAPPAAPQELPAQQIHHAEVHELGGDSVRR